MRLELLVLGCARYIVPQAAAVDLFEMLRVERVTPKAVKRVKKTGEISFMLPLKCARRIEGLAKEKGIPLRALGEAGLPVMWHRLLRRPGLLIGILLGIALLVGARCVLWEIEITGNETLSLDELEEELAASGLSRGCFLPALREDEIANALRRGDSRVAYVSVNVAGTVAHVQIRETQQATEPLRGTPANLIAKCDGIVTLPLIFEGECLVGEGDVVRAGDLLAGGLIDTQNHGYRVTRAAGQVFAKTVHVYTVSVPLVYEEKCATGRRSFGISFLFFDSVQKFFQNTNKYKDKCDIIEKTQWLTLPSGKRLPLGMTVTTASEYELCEKTRTLTEARAEAKRELEAILLENSAGRTMLQKHTETSVSQDGITLICTVVCEENIATVSEFNIQP